MDPQDHEVGGVAIATPDSMPMLSSLLEAEQLSMCSRRSNH